MKFYPRKLFVSSEERYSSNAIVTHYKWVTQFSIVETDDYKGGCIKNIATQWNHSIEIDLWFGVLHFSWLQEVAKPYKGYNVIKFL